ncbi:hypothetical protein [Chitinivorax sp. B]|uniref:hypothetical protein n=1 Tax=Chitinivorax sp. B TaxID=2502235 RepID=UPI0010F48A5F|nr:hypothetical protein [Chitinivorax sp. B]
MPTPSRGPSLRALLAWFICLVAVACGGGSGPSPFPDPTTPGTTGQNQLKLSLSKNSFTAGETVTATATLLNTSGKPVANEIVQFTVDGSLIRLTPVTGATMTNASGEATVLMTSTNGTAIGASRLVATSNIGSTEISASLAYQIGAADLRLGTLTVGNSHLSAYATTSLAINVTQNGELVSSPVTVSFRSICAANNKATLDSQANTVNGVATASYTDQGCAGQDTITASLAGSDQTASTNLTVAAPGATSLQFVNVVPEDGILALKGYGSGNRGESAKITFKLVDAQGTGVANQSLHFSLSTATGGIRFDNGGTTVNGLTDNSGQVSVTVLSGNQPTPIRVIASTADNSLATQSSGLSVSTGFPDQDSFSLSASSFNIDGMRLDGNTTELQVRLADHFNNPVPDGTSVSFVSNGGRIGNLTSGECKTESSTCKVMLTSQAPRPNNGRVQITAYAVGEESFVDLNGNIVADNDAELRDINGLSSDMGEAFVDNDENGQHTPNTDTPIDFNSNGVYDAPDGKFNGALCQPGFARCSSQKFVHVFAQATVIFSDPDSMQATWTSTSAGYPDVALTTINVSCTGNVQSYAVYLRDGRGNILPKDTALTLSLDGESAAYFGLSGTSATIPSGAPTANTRVPGMTIFPFSLSAVTNDAGQCVIGARVQLTARVTFSRADGTELGTTLQVPVAIGP